MATNAPRTKSTPQAGVAPRMTYLQCIANLETQVKLVANGARYGLLVTGTGGNGKTWTVGHTLAKTTRPYVFLKDCTPQGLYMKLFFSRNAILVVEDCPTVLRNDRALGILKMATAGITHRGLVTRTVEWTTGAAGTKALENAGVPTHFIFTGGVIIITNSTPSESNQEWAATLTRFEQAPVYGTPAEIAAHARRITRKGKLIPRGTKAVRVSARECAQVNDHLEQKACSDLRVHDRAYTTRHFISTAADWKTLVNANLTTVQPNLALAFVGELQTRPLTPRQRVQAFIAAGHGSRSTYFRYLKLVEAEKRPVTLKVTPKAIGIPDTINNKAHHDSVLAAVRAGGML